MNTKINTDEILIQLKPFFRKNNEFTADEVFKVLLELGIREADVFKVSAPSMRKAKAQKLIAKTGAGRCSERGRSHFIPIWRSLIYEG